MLVLYSLVPVSFDATSADIYEQFALALHLHNNNAQLAQQQRPIYAGLHLFSLSGRQVGEEAQQTRP